MEKKKKINIPTWAKQVICIFVAIIASGLLLKLPVFFFQDDKGIMYVRSFSMTPKIFYVMQTEIATGIEEVSATMSVAGLYYCAWAMLLTSLACLLCIYNNRWRMILCVAAAFFAGAYYLLMIYYAIEMTGNHYSTLYPNFVALLPAVVLHMMLLVRRNLAQSIMAENEDEEQEDESVES